MGSRRWRCGHLVGASSHRAGWCSHHRERHRGRDRGVEEVIVSTNAAWLAVIFTSVGCYIIKWIGMNVPQSWISSPRLLKIIGLMPVALLTALVVVNTFATKNQLVLDARAAGVGVAILALIARLPYPVVVLGAAVTSAAIHAL